MAAASLAAAFRGLRVGGRTAPATAVLQAMGARAFSAAPKVRRPRPRGARSSRPQPPRLGRGRAGRAEGGGRRGEGAGSAWQPSERK